MRPLDLCIFIVLVLGVCTQITGFDVGAKATATKIVSGVYNVVTSAENKVNNNIYDKLVSLKEKADFCSLQKKIKVEVLKAENDDIDICLNLTEYVDKFENVINDAANVILGIGRDSLTLLSNSTHCLANPDLLGCLANVTSELRTDFQQVIQDTGLVISELVDVYLDFNINILQCLEKPQSIQKRLDIITNAVCKSEIIKFRR